MFVPHHDGGFMNVLGYECGRVRMWQGKNVAGYKCGGVQMWCGTNVEGYECGGV